MNNPLITILNRLWSVDTEQLDPLPRKAIIVTRILHLCIRDFSRSTLSLQAMGLVYTTLLSLVPLLAVSFSVLKAFGVHNQIEPALLNLLTPLGDKSVEITGQIVSFVENIQVGVLGVVGILMLFYTVISLLQKIELACNNIWRVAHERRFVQRFSEYLSVIMIGPVLVFAAIALTASASSTQFVQLLLEKTGLTHVLNLIFATLPYFTAIAGFTVVYIFIPNTRVKIGSALFGAVIAGTLWQTLGWVFATMVVGSTNYTAVYSGLAILILFMFWLYLSWTILLFGASAAFYYQHPEYVNRRDPDSRLTHAQREQLALVCLYHIAERHLHGRDAPTVSELTLATGQPGRVIEPLLVTMQREGFVVPSSDRPTHWLPARAASSMSLTEILSILRGSRTLLEMPDADAEVVTRLIRHIDTCLQTGFENWSLADLIEKGPIPSGTNSEPDAIK